MRRRAAGWSAGAALLALAPAAARGQASSGDPPSFERDARGLFERYCLACHAGETPRAGLDLARFDSPERAVAEPELWALVRERVALGEMPPEGRAQPTRKEVARLVAWIDGRFGPDSPAERPLANPALRRLNRTEYRNTVRDLFGVDFADEGRLPPDEVGHGFDTAGDALSMSDVDFERYLAAAERIASRALVTEGAEHPPRRRAEPDALQGHGRDAGELWMIASVGEAFVEHDFPRDGEYALRACAGAQQAGPEAARMALCVDGEEVARFDVPEPRTAPAPREARVRVSEGRHRIGARFLNDYYMPDDPDPAQRDRNLALAWLEVEGPLDPPPVTEFQRALFARHPAELGAGRARSMLAEIARRAWRRPPEADELDALEGLANEGTSFERGMQLALEALLASPSFLFRAELDPSPGEAARALSSYELAARLSYFLWSTTPDAELSTLADSGELAREDVLRAEVRRLLRSERSIALAEGFATQWLHVRALDGLSVDARRFPAFDDALRTSMERETVLFFDAVLREERSAWELVDGRFTFVDERLAKLYGLSGVEGDAMRRVSLEGLPRRGVLTQASVLSVTSAPTRTSPSKRGKWILDALLGAPPPPPPPGVGVLDESDAAAAEASLRERLERHRSDPSCATCHATIDPLGFSLEHFDGIGAWRDDADGFPIDDSGALPDGRSFRGPLELAAVLRADDAFLRALVEKLFVYALGRGMERSDRRAVDEVLAGLDPEQPTLARMLEGVALSAPFRRRGPAD